MGPSRGRDVRFENVTGFTRPGSIPHSPGSPRQPARRESGPRSTWRPVRQGVVRGRIHEDGSSESPDDEPDRVLRSGSWTEISPTATSERSTPRCVSCSRSRLHDGRGLSRIKRVERRRCSGSMRNLVLRTSSGEYDWLLTTSFDSATSRSLGSESEPIHSASLRPDLPEVMHDFEPHLRPLDGLFRSVGPYGHELRETLGVPEPNPVSGLVG